MKKRNLKKLITLILIVIFIPCMANAQINASMRRPISPEQPMWLIHIDTWNHADPQAIIDLIPKDIRPFVVMNIALSISHDVETGRFTKAEYGYEIAESWLRTCAENRMWAIIQPSSGAYSQLPDNDMAVYEYLYNNYPNLIGFNYCEQSWGYGDDDPLATNWDDRIAHFVKLLELSDKYGGYLVVSWCGNKWSPNINPIAMQKLKPDFASACTEYTKNYILCEKYTFKAYQHDMESICLGSYLSGFSGQYGIRYDNSGWSDSDGNNNKNFTMATYGAPFLEHVMLTGQTVIDAPELIWTQCFKEVDEGSTSDGYSTRNWETFPQFDNVSVDLFRKVLDGTVRIPSRQEVIDRTKVVIVNDVNSGTNDFKYSSPETLFEGLYRMDSDGNYENNKSFFKKTGRYPTIPTVYRLNDDVANTFKVKVNRSDYSSRWPSISSKVTEFDNRFSEEYTGDLYAGRYENGWVTYNPYKTGQAASASIPFQYNTCEKMELTYSQYTAGVVKEYPNYVTFYLSNYDNVLDANLKTNTIKIYGSTSEPAYSVVDRGADLVSNVTKDWTEGVFTLTIEHNGPVDIRINCSGTATDRLTDYQTANIVVPESAPEYLGSRQYEAETFEYKGIVGIVKNGYYGNIRNYTGQGYLNFGTNSAASVRDYISVLNDGTYKLKTRYTVTGGDVNTIVLYVNGQKVATPLFAQSDSLSGWRVDSQMVDLNKGLNIIEFKANSAASQTIYFDNIVVESVNTNDIWMEAECGNAGSLWETTDDPDASNGDFLTVQSGNNSIGSAPTDTNGYISFDFNTDINGDYIVWGRVIVPTTDDDAFWVKMDNGSWLAWKEISPSTNWAWVKINAFSLASGDHTFTIAYGKDGAQLDKLFITMSDTIPLGKGGAATNCSSGNQSPIAFAGLDRKYMDCDGDSYVTITLKSSGSIDPDGTIESYDWTYGGVIYIASGEEPTVDLPIGEHKITLTVTDNEGATDTDVITINAYENSFEENTIRLEPESAEIGSNWDIISDPTASNGYYVTAKSGIQSTDAPPSTDDGLVKMPFSTTSEGEYIVYGRLNCPSSDDDSFWLKMDDDPFNSYNGLTTNGWEWVKFTTFNLTEGKHVLSIGYREDGALLDKIFITKNSYEPIGLGEPIVKCETGDPVTSVIEPYLNGKSNSNVLIGNYPNPFSSSTAIKYELRKSGYVDLIIYDICGKVVATLINEYQAEGEHEIFWRPQGISNGIYFYRLRVGDFLETKKLIYQN